MVPSEIVEKYNELKDRWISAMSNPCEKTKLEGEMNKLIDQYPELGGE